MVFKMHTKRQSCSGYFQVSKKSRDRRIYFKIIKGKNTKNNTVDTQLCVYRPFFVDPDLPNDHFKEPED